MWGLARDERPMSEADLAEVWARSLDELAEMHIEPAQRAWLQLTRPLGLVENTALIATPNEFVKEQLETRLRSLITNALSRELGRSIQLAVTVDPAITSAMPGTAAGHEHPAPGAADSPEPGLPMDRRMPDLGGGRAIGRHGQSIGDQAADSLGLPRIGIDGRRAQDHELAGGGMDPATGRPRSSASFARAATGWNRSRSPRTPGRATCSG